MNYYKYTLIVLKIIFISLFVPNIVFSQAYFSIDTVYSFTPGTGQNTGQSEEYFPENIFGEPSEIANEDIQEVRETEILSLGLGGEIIVGAKNEEIFNHLGPEFIIYENVFNNPFNGNYFCEPAEISVSYDGVNFKAFPFDSVTLHGCAGTHPTLTKDRDYDPYNCGGDQFDLDDIEVNIIKYIKIKDITSIILNNPEHKYYDPTLTGFDLDAVIFISSESTNIMNDNFNSFINTVSFVKINTKESSDIYVYNLLGELIYSKQSVFNIQLYKSNLPKGVYFIKVLSSNNLTTYKFIN